MENEDLLDQLDSHLASPNLAWLLGAGISYNAHIPLMHPLTEHVLGLLNEKSKSYSLIQAIRNELPQTCHVEHILSHVGDYLALLQRSERKEITIGSSKACEKTLKAAHDEIVRNIAKTVRWGLIEIPHKIIGKSDDPVVDIDEHRNFINACFHTRNAGLQERRGPVRLFTTNYDTLLEDALALCCIPYWDGFEGGAVAFRPEAPKDEDSLKKIAAHVVKLHGSIDWYVAENERQVMRLRDGDKYPSKDLRVLIHPQSTKYLAAQRDPFASQFDQFRRAIRSNRENVLAICGYSFGDDHINEEIELAMDQSSNKTTLIAFSREEKAKNQFTMPSALDVWRKTEPWGKRVYVVTQRGLYNGSSGPHFLNKDRQLEWWKFEGVSQLLRDGARSFFS